MEILKTKNGFTLLELLIGISILFIIISIIFNSFSTFRHNQLLGGESGKISSMLQEVRSKTVASKDDTVHGLHLETSKITSFKGETFILDDLDNKELVLDPLTQISSIDLNGGGVDIVFQRLTGKTDHYGTITLILNSEPSKNKVIQIGKTGVIEVL